MTWYAHEVLCIASPEALAYVHAEPRLLPHASVVRSPLQHDWSSEEARHDLPTQGLLVVQPVVSAKEAGEWYESGVLAWDTLEADAAALRILPQQFCSHLPDASLDDFLPANALA